MTKKAREFLSAMLVPAVCGFAALMSGYWLAYYTWLGQYNWFFSASSLIYIFFGWAFWLPYRESVNRRYQGKVPLSVELLMDATYSAVGGGVFGLMFGSFFIS
jgi:hypothetical protein